MDRDSITSIRSRLRIHGNTVDKPMKQEMSETGCRMSGEAETEEIVDEYENYRTPNKLVGIFVGDHGRKYRAECRKIGFMGIKKRLMREQGGRYDSHSYFPPER